MMYIDLFIIPEFGEHVLLFIERTEGKPGNSGPPYQREGRRELPLCQDSRVQ